MIKPLSDKEFNQIRELLEIHSGIVLAGDQTYLVESRLSALAEALSASSFNDLIQILMVDEAMMLRVVDLMTIKETLWFRDDSCWNTLERIIIPELIRRLETGTETIRIWSAACATGQEPYSFQILLDEVLAKRRRSDLLARFETVGTDISKAALTIAEKASYDPFTLSRGMTTARQQRYFKKTGNMHTLEERIRKPVRFWYLNLMDSFKHLGRFDLIFCRNVAIYFSSTVKKQLFAKIATALRPDGFLLLGATESLFGVSDAFETAFFENGIYYRLKNLPVTPDPMLSARPDNRRSRR
jgi:chemotaxis protein methyltransferase CheR